MWRAVLRRKQVSESISTLYRIEREIVPYLVQHLPTFYIVNMDTTGVGADDMYKFKLKTHFGPPRI